MVNLTDCIDKPYYKAFHHIMDGDYTHYWFGGGRGTFKSSFVSLAIIEKIMENAEEYLADPENKELLHAVCFRKVKDTLTDSVYEQLKWAINKLGVDKYFNCTTHPLKIVYKPTGQKILFRGLDKAEKAKSIKTSEGYFGLCWFEELQEYHGMAEIRKAYQSVMRGTDETIQVICSYNPPENIKNWVNVEELIKRSDRFVHKTNYTQMRSDWLGRQFITDAEELKRSNRLAYDNEYMGIPTGSGGKIFNNVEECTITDEQIEQFDKIKYGLDWGFATDPFAFVKLHYDKTRKVVYIFDEIYQTGLLNDKAIEKVNEKVDTRDYIIADSAEPKSIKEFQNAGVRIMGALKGKDSIAYGIKFLQRLGKIYIDPVRCPNAFKEFSTYEFERDKNGEFKDGYPDKDNHLIDSLRYSLETEAKEMWQPKAVAIRRF